MTKTTDPAPYKPGKFKMKAAIRDRRAVSIMSYFGPNGGGKTLCAVQDCLPTLEGIKWDCENPAHRHTQQGITSGYRTVLSTVKLFDWRQPPDPETGMRPLHPYYVPLKSYAQIVNAEHCDLLLDEVVGIASSRDSQSLPVQIANKLHQLRRADVVLRYTGVSWARADKVMREATSGVTVCRGYFSYRPEGSIWPQRMLFRFKTYDAVDFDEWSAGQMEDVNPVVSQWFFRPGKAAMDAYLTLDAVEALGWAAESGMCMVCGGKRTVPRCSCSHEETQPEAEAAESAVPPQAAKRRRGAEDAVPQPQEESDQGGRTLVLIDDLPCDCGSSCSDGVLSAA